MFNKKIFVLSLLLMLVLGMAMSVSVLAQGTDTNTESSGTAAENLFNTIRDNQLHKLKDTSLPGTESDEYDLLKEIAKIIKVALGTLVMIFMSLVIFAGFKWMTSGGNEETIGKAKKMMSAALIGVAVIFFAYAITLLVFNLILNNKLA